MYILVLLCRNNCEAREVNFKINVSLQNRNNTIIRSSETTTPHITIYTTMFVIHVLGCFLLLHLFLFFMLHYYYYLSIRMVSVDVLFPLNDILQLCN